MLRKTLAIGIILLFLGTIIAPAVSSDAVNSRESVDVEDELRSEVISEPTSANEASSRTGSQQSSRSGSTSFTYGPLGNRISNTDANGDTTYYLYEGTNVIQDRQQDGTLAHEYVSGVGGKLAMIDHTDDGNKPAGEDEVLYYLHDILGSVVALINAGGNVVERYYYEPYGETVITDSTGTVKRNDSLFGNTYMWTGKQYDPKSELYHFPARTYSTNLGRWLQRDPLGYVDGLNLYEYVRSNPLKYVDPLGLEGGPGDTSDFWLLHNQAHKLSSEAGAAFDEASMKFSIGVPIAMGGGAIFSRLGLITSSIFVGECAVDEVISISHGPDAAIVADAAMGGPGLYSVKEMAEEELEYILGKFSISVRNYLKALRNPKRTVQGRITRKQLAELHEEFFQFSEDLEDLLPEEVIVIGHVRMIPELSGKELEAAEQAAYRRLMDYFEGSIPNIDWNIPFPIGSKNIRQVMADLTLSHKKEIGLMRDSLGDRFLVVGGKGHIDVSRGEIFIAHTHDGEGLLWPSVSDIFASIQNKKLSEVIIGQDGTMVRFNLVYPRYDVFID